MLTKNSFKYRAFVLFLFTLMLWGGGKVTAQTPLGFRIPDVTITEKDTFTVTIVADSLLTGQEVYSYRFYLTYSPTYIEFLGVDGVGSVLTSWGEPTVNSSNAGTLVIAGAGTPPLAGTGDMVTLKFVSKRFGGIYIYFNTIESYLNERNPSSVYDNGYVYMTARSYPNIYPDSYNLFIGDVVQMSVSGGVTPYTYSVVNTDVAVITEQSKVQAVGTGTTKVFVTDGNGEESYTTGVFDVRALRMDIEEVSTWPGDTFYIPVKIEVAPGYGVYSGRIVIGHSVGITGITNDVVAGDFQATIQSKAGSGSITVSFASSSPITGNGVLCYLAFKANTSGNHWFRFVDMHFNESLIAWPVKSTYYINVNYLTNLYFSPSSGTLLWGDMLKITASGGTVPYTYSISDPSIATIDIQGNLQALSGGEITVTAVDAHGSKGTSGVFTVNDCNVKVNNSDGILDTDTRVPITISELPQGKGIYGFKAGFTFDDTNLDYVRVEAVSSILLEGTLTGNTISVAGASSDGITTGILGYLVFRIKNTLPLNGTSAVNITSFAANENTIYSSLMSGVVTRVEQVSYRPVADAGQNFSVQEGNTAQLSGTASYDFDNDTLTYNWTAPAGITLDDPASANPSFIAPWVSENTQFIFTLIVNDGIDDSNPDQVTITVLQLNQQPAADAGENKSYMEGSSVSLDGSNSFDPDGDPLSYSWSSLDGIVLFNSTGISPSFILPLVIQNTSYRFILAVNDGVMSSDPDTVEITSLQVNEKPVAFAGGDFTLNEGDPASLDGSLSYDADNDPITYLWTAPPNATLSSYVVANPSFTAPAVHRDSMLVFSLVVNDGTKDSDPDEVNVKVLNIDILSTEAKIDSVMLQDMVSFDIDTVNNTVILYMPYGYDVRAMVPVFRISDQAIISPASGSVWDFSMPVYYAVTAEDRTTVSTWKVVVDESERTVQRQLVSGWNWISLNIKPADMDITALFGGLSHQELDYMKSTEYSAIYYNSTGWFGDLVSFPEKRTVRYKKATAENFSVTGREINPGITSISLVLGWNSIAYLLNRDVTVGNAFKISSIPSGNVVLKGLEGSSVYFEGSGWSGEIDTLRVLYGYKISVEQPGSLMYDPLGVTKNASVKLYSRDELLGMYNLYPSQFAYSSTLIAEVLPDNGDEFIQQGDLLAAYAGNECRGICEVNYIPALNRYVFVLTYYSDNVGEELVFKVISQKFSSEFDTDFSVSFTADEITGRSDSPKSLHTYVATGVIDVNAGKVLVYPNPVSDMLTVSSDKSITRISVFSPLGDKVLELLQQSYKVNIPIQQLAQGVYTLRIETEDNLVIRKIVKSSK